MAKSKIRKPADLADGDLLFACGRRNPSIP